MINGLVTKLGYKATRIMYDITLMVLQGLKIKYGSLRVTWYHLLERSTARVCIPSPPEPQARDKHTCSWLWCLTALPYYYHIMSSLHITMCTHYNMYQLYCVNTLHTNITTNNNNDLLIWYFRAWRDSRAIQTCWLELQEYMRLEYCSLLKTPLQLGLLLKNSWMP